MDQFVPDVSENDITRVVGRDFSAGVHDVIYEMIRRLEVREKPRVVLACLKNSKGNVEKLKGELTNAGGYWREIISEAEYPNYPKKSFRIDTLPRDEKERIIEKDKKQYVAWLRAADADETRSEAQHPHRVRALSERRTSRMLGRSRGTSCR